MGVMNNGKMINYFDDSRIGSSILGQVITNIEPFEICLDYATIPIDPNEHMEWGKMFEDLVETYYGQKWDFWDKYFKTDLSKIPEYKGKREDIQQILEILDSKNIEDAVANGYFLKKGYIIKDGNIYSEKEEKPLFGEDREKTLQTRQASRHRCLDQISAHDYRRPLPESTWETLQIMLDRFGNRPFAISNTKRKIGEWMSNPGIKVDFQVEYFWKSENGSDCRAKFDMIWSWKLNGQTYAIAFDLKVTGNWPSFVSNWKSKYIWQSKHYMEGFIRYCQENGFNPGPHMWYIIQESKDPQITHIQTLSQEELFDLTEPYEEALIAIQEWIDKGRPVKGYTKQRTVNRWGRTVQ